MVAVVVIVIVVILVVVFTNTGDSGNGLVEVVVRVTLKGVMVERSHTERSADNCGGVHSR